MSDIKTCSDLAADVKRDMIAYFRHMEARVERFFRSVPKESLWIKPYAYGNSVGHLVLHLTGNLHHYVGAGIAGTGYERDRDREFNEPNPPEPEEAIVAFHSAIDLVVATIESLDDAALVKPVANQKPIQSQFGLLLVVAAHMNNHIGQMAYLVRAHGRDDQMPASW
jgi:uncharacterized damage-inducible protein DinB